MIVNEWMDGWVGGKILNDVECRQIDKMDRYINKYIYVNTQIDRYKHVHAHTYIDRYINRYTCMQIDRQIDIYKHRQIYYEQIIDR